ncbi:MAG: methionyl-tRNA formyltransferase [Acholeplasmatales bacterium]|nr:methionyl-tRNA formyltransferase [Acholeplasmatales bacterium]
MRIVFMGTPEFACNVLSGLNDKYEIALVISQPNREKKKGALIPTPVANLATELGLKLIQPEKIANAYSDILEAKADVLVSAAYGQYIPSKILNLFKYKINVHGSLLPLHRGGAPIQRCLINGDTKTGVTIMEMAKGLDTGKIYSMAEYQIEDDDNSTTLFEKLSVIGRDLLLNTIEDIVSDKNLGIPQDDSKSTYSKNIEKEEELIKLNNTSKNIVNQIRGLAMTPGAYINVSNINLKVYKASIREYSGNELPGTILSIKKEILIKTKDGAISLELVQMPGKKIITGKEFSNGQKLFTVGQVLE